MNQSTIARSVACTGVGLHSGVPVRLSLHPADDDTGIVFVRLTETGPVEIAARPDRLATRARATVLQSETDESITISTVEHLLATLLAFGIDNLQIEIDGPEIPVFDGSARAFVDLLDRAGRKEGEVARRSLALTSPVEVRDADRWIRAEPADRLRLSYAIDFAHPTIGRQALADLVLDAVSFERECADARTFGFEHEVEALRAAGLARGGSLENTVVLGETGVLNPEGLRSADEFVRHKMLDLIGDLALLGAPLAAHVEVSCGGHTLHHALVHAIEAASPAAG